MEEKKDSEKTKPEESVKGEKLSQKRLLVGYPMDRIREGIRYSRGNPLSC